MTDEEKKAVDKLKRSANYFVMPMHETTIILNLIEKQSKMIDLMAEQLTSPINGKEWVIKYYEKKVGE